MEIIQLFIKAIWDMICGSFIEHINEVITDMEFLQAVLSARQWCTLRSKKFE